MGISDKDNIQAASIKEKQKKAYPSQKYI